MVKLAIGTVLSELDAPGAAVTLDDKTGVWEHLSTADGQHGFVFSAVLSPFERGHEGEAALALWKARGDNPKLSFAERTDLCNAMDRLSTSVTDHAKAGALSLVRARCLKSALALIPAVSKDQPYRGFITERGSTVVYSEPAGTWYADTDHLWAEAEKFRDTPSADDLAWEAASTPQPGECEGYLGCYIAVLGVGPGRYLKTLPKGAHAAEAITEYAGLKETLGQIADLVAELTPEDRADCTKQVDEATRWLKAAATSNERTRAEQALGAIRAALKQPQTKPKR